MAATSMNSGRAMESSAGVPPALAVAHRKPPSDEITVRRRGSLPHWERDSATYFITFRLADSLPKSVLARIESERWAIVQTAKSMNRELSSDERKKIQALSSQSIERYLDNGAGACHLRGSEIAVEVARALLHFDQQRYQLFAWCVMPNHVHVVVRLFPGQSLAKIVHAWKTFTAKQANRILGRGGKFWQREYYDHLIRGEADFGRALKYVAENPDKAGLKNWNWVWIGGEHSGNAAEDGGATLRPNAAGDGGATRHEAAEGGGATL